MGIHLDYGELAHSYGMQFHRTPEIPGQQRSSNFPGAPLTRHPFFLLRGPLSYGYLVLYTEIVGMEKEILCFPPKLPCLDSFPTGP